MDDDGLRDAIAHALRANLMVMGGEKSGAGGGHLGDEEGENPLLCLVRAFAGAEAFDVAEDAGGEEAARRHDGAGDGFEFVRHVAGRVCASTGAGCKLFLSVPRQIAQAYFTVDAARPAS